MGNVRSEAEENALVGLIKAIPTILTNRKHK